jgi:flagellar biosynthetic protein FliR
VLGLDGDYYVMSELAGLLKQYSIQQIIFAGGLLAARVLGMIWLAPFLGGKLVPPQVKMGIAFALGIAVFPHVITISTLQGLFDNSSGFPVVFRLAGYLLKELFIGVILGFVVLTIWHGAEMIGRFVDTARGSAMGSALVPQMKSQASTLGSVYYQLLLVIFLALDGHLTFIGYFFQSFVLIPVHSVPRFDVGMWPFYEMIIRLTADLFLAAITLSAPVMIAIFVTDICMGLFNKVAPQINVLFLMMPFKAVLGILFAMIGLFLFVRESEKAMAHGLDSVWLAIKYLIPF